MLFTVRTPLLQRCPRCFVCSSNLFQSETAINTNQPDRRALAAAAAFRVVFGDGGEALRADGNSKGARVSPLWRQRFFVQARICDWPEVVDARRRGSGRRGGGGHMIHTHDAVT